MPDAVKHPDLNASSLSADAASADAKEDGFSRSNGHATPSSEAAQRATIARMRDEACERARPLVMAGGAPIRVMARMVNEVITACREQDIPEAIIDSEIVNRTIGDIDVRRISAKDDGEQFVSLADDLGLALPGEVISGHTASGRAYRWIQRRQQQLERDMLAQHIDLRLYELSGAGVMPLREALATHAERSWGVSFP